MTNVKDFTKSREEMTNTIVMGLWSDFMNFESKIRKLNLDEAKYREIITTHRSLTNDAVNLLTEAHRKLIKGLETLDP